MKKLTLALLLAATTSCARDRGTPASQINRAEIMVQAQAKDAACTLYAPTGPKAASAPDVVYCDVPGKDKVVPFIAVYGRELKQPFQAFPLEAQPQQPATQAPQPTPPAAPTPDAGSASE